MPKPAVLFGGPSPEHDVSILTGLQAARALGEVSCVYWAKDGQFWEVDPGLEAEAFADGVPRRSGQLRLVAGEGLVGKRRALELSAVVNCCHGGPGEDGTVQAAMDLAGIPYTGPNVPGAALGMDKLAFGDVVTAAGLPSLPRLALGAGLGKVPWDGPSIVKPRFGGSSIGIEVVEDATTAVHLLSASPHLRAGAVVEPYRADAFDLNVAVRSWPDLQLSAIEKPVRRQGGPILGYHDKYLGGEGMASAPRELPADLPAEVEGRVREAALTVARLTGVRGVARLDFLAAGDDAAELYVNEINTIPGSLARYLWVEPGPVVPFRRLLDDLLEEAARRPSFHWSTQGADGVALRAAGSIAGKLA
ncbi:MAG: D-alanine--D-alanine ligase family protein [Acidimicrobiales bacterium]